jgi:hypothetical protein
MPLATILVRGCSPMGERNGGENNRPGVLDCGRGRACGAVERISIRHG